MKIVVVRHLPAARLASLFAVGKLIEISAWQIVHPVVFGFLSVECYGDQAFTAKLTLWVYKCVLPLVIVWVAVWCAVTMYNTMAMKKGGFLSIGTDD